MSAREFFLMTKQRIDAKLVPDNVHLHAGDNSSTLVIDEINNYSYVLYLCLKNDSINQAYQMFLSENEDDELITGKHSAYKSDLSLLFELIHRLKLKDFLICAISEFADIPDDDFFTIPVIEGKILKDVISCYLEGYDADFWDSARLIGIRQENY